MKEYGADETQDWVRPYFNGYVRYMLMHHPDLYIKFRGNIFPPQTIGSVITILQGAIHSDEDYNEILRITDEFCNKYKNPVDFPAEF